MDILGRTRKERDFNNPYEFMSLDLKGRGDEGAEYRSFIPQFLYKPTIGYPRFLNIPKLRQLGRSPYVSIVKDAILSNVENMDWEIVPKEGYKFEGQEGSETPIRDKDVNKLRDFLERPNYDGGTFKSVFVRQAGNDILDLDTGVLVKTFDNNKRLVAVQCRDGGSFVKNPDIHGTYRNRADFMGSINQIVEDENKIVNPYTQIDFQGAREKAAYFQYVTGGQVIVPFGKKELVWMIRNSRSYDLYGESPVMGIMGVLDFLMNSIRSDVEYFKKNNIPNGFIELEGATPSEVENFKQQFNNEIYKTNELGEIVRMLYKVPIFNRKAEFKNIEFSSQEMETLEKQKWYSKMVWAQFGVTSTEIGFTEDAKGQANQIVQSKAGRKRAILPMCNLIEETINQHIIPDLGYEGMEFRFKTFDIDNEKARVELRREELEAGLKTINEAREDEGMEPLPDGDRLIINDNQEPQQDFNKQQNDRDLENENSNKENLLKSYEYEAERLSDKEESARLEKYSEELGSKIENYFTNAMNKIMALIEREMERQKPLNNIGKSFLDIYKRAIKYLDTPEDVEAEVRNTLSEIMRLSEMNVGEELGLRFKPNEEAEDFIETYTFDLIKGLNTEIREDLRSELQRGLMNGEGTGSLKERVRSVFDTNLWRSYTIARTEVTRANNYGRLEAFNRSGKQVYKYISIVDDNRTTKVSYAMRDKYGSKDKAIPINEEFSVWVDGKRYHGQAPPFMPNDRDVVLFVLEEEL